MATKAGRAEIHDIKAGKTLWKAAIIDGRRVPEAVRITMGAQRMSFPREDGTHVAMWVYQQAGFVFDGRAAIGTVICDPMWTPHLENVPVFDKLFVNRAAAARWIRRYESNRIETLCEDRRVFERGASFLLRFSRKNPDELNLDLLEGHRFQHTELWIASQCGLRRRAVLNETPNG